MNPHVREKLCRMLAAYGVDLLNEPRRCENLLRDVCPQYKRELHVLVAALREQIPADLTSPAIQKNAAAAVGRLTKRLEDNLGLASGPARWAVESWAVALGVATEQQLSAVKPRQSTAPVTPPVIVRKSPRSRAGYLRAAAIVLGLAVIAAGSEIALSWNSPAPQIQSSSKNDQPVATGEPAMNGNTPAVAPAIVPPQPPLAVELPAVVRSECPTSSITDEEIDIVRGALRPQVTKVAVDRPGDR